jgi:hypothetical protein
MSLRKPFIASRSPSSQAYEGTIEHGSQLELSLIISGQGVVGPHLGPSSAPPTIESSIYPSQDTIKAAQFQTPDVPFIGAPKKKLNTAGLTKRKAGHQQQQLSMSSANTPLSGIEIAKARRSFEGIERPPLITPSAKKIIRTSSRGSFTSMQDQSATLHQANKDSKKPFSHPANDHGSNSRPQSRQDVQDSAHTLTSAHNDETNITFSSNYHLNVTRPSPFENENDQISDIARESREKSVGDISVYDLEEESLYDPGSEHMQQRPSKRRKSHSLQARHLVKVFLCLSLHRSFSLMFSQQYKNEDEVVSSRHGTPRLSSSHETFYATFGRQLDEYAEVNAEKYEKAMQRWSECTMEEWIDGAEGKSESYLASRSQAKRVNIVPHCVDSFRAEKQILQHLGQSK